MFPRWPPSRALLILAITLLVIAILPSKRSGSIADADLQHRVERAESLLEDADLDMDPGRYGLDILQTRQSLSRKQVARMLRKWNHHAGPVYYWLSRPDRDIYAMSALGVDGEHHLASAYLEGFQPFETDNPMIPLYVLAQRKRYQLDSRNYWGKDDVWQTSRQAFLYPRGDCEDHAIVLADWLTMMGEDARVVVGDWGRERHAWVILIRNGREYLLEATKKSGLGRNRPYPLASLHPEYKPDFMFNHEYFWVNTGSNHTTRYRGRAWQRRSRLFVSG